MDDIRINLSTITAEFISENSEIPPDITFKFTEGDLGEVSAHKIILAMVSKIFRNMFFVHNTSDKSAKEIVMKGTNRPTFQVMINAIYNAKSMAESLQGKTVHEIFAVLYLVTKYEISQLVLAVKESLCHILLTEDTVLDVATDAMEYLNTFEEDAQKVLRCCAKFLNSKFIDAKSVRQFVTKNSDQFAIVNKLLVLIDEMNPPLCINCSRNPCLHGVGVKMSQTRVGLKVAHNPTATCTGTKAERLWNPKLEYFNGEIIGIEDWNVVQLKYNSRLRGSNEKSGVTAEYDVIKNGELRFVFRCK